MAKTPAKPSTKLKGAKKAKAAPKPHGRPTVYSNTLAAKICERLAAGETLNAICRDEGMPTDWTVRSWALDPAHPFSTRYRRARSATT